MDRITFIEGSDTKHTFKTRPRSVSIPGETPKQKKDRELLNAQKALSISIARNTRPKKPPVDTNTVIGQSGLVTPDITVPKKSQTKIANVPYYEVQGKKDSTHGFKLGVPITVTQKRGVVVLTGPKTGGRNHFHGAIPGGAVEHTFTFTLP